MLFSIVIPVYNVEKYLDECMRSIIGQIHDVDEDCEVILIDDGSTDESAKMCDIYKSKFPNIIKVFHNTNHGLLFTRRFGFKHSEGDYIINCDSDDILEINTLYRIKETIKKYHNPDIIMFNYNEYDDLNKTEKYKNIFTNDKECEVPKNIVLNEFMSNHRIVSICGKVCKRSCINIDLDYNKYGKLSTGEDTLQSIEFFSNAKTFVYLNEPLYNYRYGTGMTRRFDEKYYVTFKKILCELEKKKFEWGLNQFDKLFSIKVLQIAGRTITQSRYNNWKSISKQKEYLISVYNDKMFKDNIAYVDEDKKNLQKNHYILLKLLKNKKITLICVLLKIKNIMSK